MFLFCLVFAMFCARLFICALWSPAGKGLTSRLSFVVSSVSSHFPIGILGQVWYLIVSIPDLCTITYFYHLCSLSHSLHTWSLITIGRLTLEIYFFKMQMDDNDDENTYEIGQTITILKPPLSLRVI